ncbi:MAG: HAD-IB family phosphatase [Ardenticatenaceae bacterium]|nr:HAD-IB family phosphatase [Ardenticatenaceae bacterium]MCB9443517.1 HAD-IB family phosphatase [Ardenticatenaceae bacterium]
MNPHTVASDLEGTITAGETWRGMRDYLVENGYEKRYRRFFVRRIPGLFLFRMGWVKNERAFKERWILGLLRLFKGLDEAEMAAMAKFVAMQTLWPTRREKVVAELQAHQANGRSVIIVTGLFEPILQILARELGGFDCIGTPLLFENGRFTGKTATPLNIGQHKVEHLQARLYQGKLAAAYGDTVRDIPMLELAQEPVAVHPDARLRQTALNRGWRILE